MDEFQPLPLAGCHEPVSSLSHLLGAFYFAWLATVLVRRGRGDRARISSLTIMGVSSVLLLLLSSAYHLVVPGPLREFMIRADVSAIFLLMAGSLTPIHAILFQGFARWLPLTLIWITAVLGMILRIIYFDALNGPAGISLFLVFGWAGVFTFIALWRRYGWSFVKPALFSGLSYTFGAIVLLFHRPILVAGVIGPHEIWHFAVLCGLGLHWYFVFQFAAGYQPRSKSAATSEFQSSSGRPAFDRQHAAMSSARIHSPG